jgi:hypothetical protein
VAVQEGQGKEKRAAVEEENESEARGPIKRRLRLCLLDLCVLLSGVCEGVLSILGPEKKEKGEAEEDESNQQSNQFSNHVDYQ